MGIFFYSACLWTECLCLSQEARNSLIHKMMLGATEYADPLHETQTLNRFRGLARQCFAGLCCQEKQRLNRTRPDFRRENIFSLFVDIN